MFYRFCCGEERRPLSRKTQDTKIMTKRELKKEIDQLRNDMAAEFVKRDDDIVKVRTEVIKTRNAFDNTLAKLAKRVDWLEEVVGFLNCFQYGLMQACGVTDSQREIAGRIAKERHDALKKGDWDEIIGQTKGEHEAPKVEKIETTKPEADLFSQAETPKRTRKEIRDEAFSRNLISLDAIRVRYKSTKDAIDRAVKWWEIKTQTIEGSGCKYVERADIGKIKEFITPKCAG